MKLLTDLTAKDALLQNVGFVERLLCSVSICGVSRSLALGWRMVHEVLVAPRDRDRMEVANEGGLWVSVGVDVGIEMHVCRSTSSGALTELRCRISSFIKLRAALE